MKKILVPTDFSQVSEMAVKTAKMIAKKNNSEILFLNIIELNSGEVINTTGGPSSHASFADGVLVQESIKYSKDEMARLVDVTRFQGIKSEYEIKLGNPFNHIFSTINNHDIDFIVMGTKGASGLSEIIIGSNTEKIVRKAKCPVLSVKSALTETSFQEIVYATNFSTNENKVVSAIKNLQKIFNSKVHLLWVNTPNNFKSDTEITPLLENFIASHKLKNCKKHIFNDLIEEDGIRNFANYINADLIAMGTNSYTGLNRLIRGSVAEDMVNHAVRPVLTVSMKV